MKIERFAAEDMSHAIRAVRAKMGSDAVILSNQRIGNQVEVVAASEYDEALFTEVPQRINKKAEMAAHNQGANREAIEKESQASNHVPKQPEPFGIDALELQQELESLRNSLRQELAQFQSRGLNATNAQATVRDRLRQCGFNADVIEALVRRVSPDLDAIPDWRATLKLVGKQIAVAKGDLMTEGGVFSVLGSTGVGKTTTVVKLAAQFSYRHGRNNVALITTDTHRIGAQEQLQHFARLLDVPFAVASSASELIRNVNQFKHKKLVLIDTAGISQRDLDLTKQLSLFKKSLPDIRHLLVLSATAQPGLSQEVIKAFRQVPIDSAVITKIDEAVELGSVLSGVMKAKLPVSYLCDGQNIPEDLEQASKEDLIQSVYQLAQDHSPLRPVFEEQEIASHA
ncbi:MAG: flagellar biosynthesis protein FlhF [Candidatus Azotimanducaceae bacterium]|jgi:flagellar biosynthesis protein FlhF